MSAAETLARKLKAKRSGRYFIACCPAHHDRSPSLSFYQGHTAVVVHCFAGCDSEAVIDALRARGLWEDQRGVRRRRRELSYGE